MGALFSFDGRVGRQTYWLKTVIIYAIALAIGAVLGVIQVATASDTGTNDGVMASTTVIWFAVVGVAFFASLTTTVKRWHDRGKSGWWVFISWVPIIGSIWALIECGFLSGTPGPNQYGPQP